MQSEPICYPTVNFIENNTSQKPQTIVVSDSFYWSMFNIGVGTKLFSLGGFWYYNQQIYPDSFEKSTMVKNQDIKSEILKNEVVVIMSTEANLPKFPWGFVDNSLAAFAK